MQGARISDMGYARAKHVLIRVEGTPSSESTSFRPRGVMGRNSTGEKSFLDPSHSLGMTDLGSSPLRLGVFAGDIPIPTGVRSAPYYENLRVLRDLRGEKSLPPLRPLRGASSFAFAQDKLCG